MQVDVYQIDYHVRQVRTRTEDGEPTSFGTVATKRALVAAPNQEDAIKLATAGAAEHEAVEVAQVHKVLRGVVIADPISPKQKKQKAAVTAEGEAEKQD